MWNDPIVEKVRQIRRQIEEECDRDIEKIYNKALEIQKSYNQKIITQPLKIEEEMGVRSNLDIDK